ncbi:hypothetical protein EGR_00956 [Echinococcus granulosus]|uniref:Uncharacterized protein n=1 Tax=Echinococcus granulosus TaxID=6210 RepID=W6V0J1_ECHGR|nr:hypothetical protein EGR_00956 [Echinococcus granulosus]EUB64412.1 hypothetical protein EGR_00956 [Echinococcus granulosus]
MQFSYFRILLIFLLTLASVGAKRKRKTIMNEDDSDSEILRKQIRIGTRTYARRHCKESCHLSHFLIRLAQFTPAVCCVWSTHARVHITSLCIRVTRDHSSLAALCRVNRALTHPCIYAVCTRKRVCAGRVRGTHARTRHLSRTPEGAEMRQQEEMNPTSATTTLGSNGLLGMNLQSPWNSAAYTHSQTHTACEQFGPLVGDDGDDDTINDHTVGRSSGLRFPPPLPLNPTTFFPSLPLHL